MINERNISFSVVIPIYNTEKWLDRCIESVIKQDYANFEVILVDDGSTDDSAQKCDEWCAKDERIFCIHKKNGGVAAARNTGIDMATGEYIAFLDSDDYWEQSDVFENLSIVISQNVGCDFVLVGVDTYTKDGKYVKSFMPKACCGDKMQMCDIILRKYNYVSSPCIKIVRREIIPEKKLYFIPGLLCEDIEWSGRLIVECGSFAVYPHSFYHRMYGREGALTGSVTCRNVEDILHSIELGIETIDSKFDLKERKIFYQYWAYQFAMMLFIASGFRNKSEIKDMYPKIKKYGYLLSYSASAKVVATRIAYKILGIDGTMFLFSLRSALKNGK